ncbi:MAG: heavy-metal-associated domain-containing protein [Moritella sp.]|uniref:heavy metal-associated domain-containing protein n=1 Tax=Moritella sp. TaxID=78556 RepID=UPI001E058CD9|nr:heavy metal-associated domain-containing protein [Moritella sp.]NQZ49728.1 heavy-metal-associated domain-containing protein [Moritella sp.]
MNRSKDRHNGHEFVVEGASCASCVGKIEAALNRDTADAEGIIIINRGDECK